MALEQQAQLALHAASGPQNVSGTPVTTTVPTRQREIKRLFRDVEKALEHAPCLGEMYTLLTEWRQLQQVSAYKRACGSPILNACVALHSA